MIRINPISITATTQEYAVEIAENLCQPFCLTSEVQPQGSVTFSTGQIKVANGIAYVEIIANGNVVYNPMCGDCASKVKQFSESVWLGFAGTSVPTITLTQTTPLQMADNVKCCNKAYGWKIITTINVLATFPAA